MLKRSAAVSAAVMVLSLPMVQPATAQETACETLSGTVVLHADLQCGGGWIELRDGLDLDLNGFAMEGAANTDQFAEVTIANGEIESLDIWRGHAELTDVRARSIGISGHSLTALRVDAEYLSMSPSNPSTVRIRNSRVGGISSVFDSTLDIEGSRIGDLEGAQEGATLRLVDNEIGSIWASDSSLELEENLVGGSVYLRSLRAGSIRDNHFDGPDSELQLDGFGDADVVNNRFTNGKGMWAAGAGPLAVSRNRFVDNAGSGLSVVDGGSAVTVANNVAARNDEHGIDAPGVTDGGGNKVADNGATPECIGVICAPK